MGMFDFRRACLFNTLTLCCQRFFQNEFPIATHVLHRLSSSSFAHCQTMGAATRSTAQTRLCKWEGQKISLSEVWLHCLANMVSKCQQGNVSGFVNASKHIVLLRTLTIRYISGNLLRFQCAESFPCFQHDISTKPKVMI